LTAGSPSPDAAGHRSLLGVLRRYGLLLESDPSLPSVVSLINGNPIAGSWWGHPAGGAIYNEIQRLADRTDLLIVKLLNGKATFVAKALWPHLYAIGVSGERWQRQGLKPEDLRLLAIVRRHGSVTTDEPKARAAAVGSVSKTALVLERKLLVVGTQVHTENGRHVKRLQSWPHWARRVRLASRLRPGDAKAELNERVLRMNKAFAGRARLPWQS